MGRRIVGVATGELIMSKRRARHAALIEQRRIEDGALLDSALAPYERDHNRSVLDLRASSALFAAEADTSMSSPQAQDEDRDELVTITLGGSATIDIRRSHGRVSVVRSRPRRTATLAL